MTLDKKILDKVILNDDRHFYYKDSVELADHLAFHIDGYEYNEYANHKSSNSISDLKNVMKDPRKLMDYDSNIYFDIIVGAYRPDENKDSDAYTYRKSVYKAITKATMSSAITEYMKITRSADWSIKLSEESPSKVKEGQTLNDYLEDYPGWNNITYFANTVLVKKICSDPNQLAIVLPEKFTEVEGDSEPPNPIVYFFESKYVLDYVEGEYSITYDLEEDRYWVVTRVDFVKYKIDKTNDNQTLVETFRWDYSEELEELNVKKLKGVFKKMRKTDVMYDSFLSPMLPNLDIAARERSDLDASTVRAMFPQPWRMAGMVCRQCTGVGRVQGKGEMIACPECKGKGTFHSPSQTIEIKNAEIGELPVPVPPAGFIEPTTAIIELQQKSIESHKFEALGAINLDFLKKTPLNESGKSKEVDRDSLNNSIQTVAENLVHNLNFIIKATNDVRYMALVPIQQDRNEMLPTIAVPQDYSIITNSVYLDDFKDAKAAGASDGTVRSMESMFIEKKYRDAPKIKEITMAYLKLNPFPYKTPQELGDMLLNGEISKTDAIISANVIPFVDKAVSKDTLFLSKDLTQQMEVMNKFAEEKEVEETNTEEPLENEGNREDPQAD